jgi:hypothetical protein
MQLSKMDKTIKEYMAKIGQKGGKSGKRTDMKGANSPAQIAAQEGRAKAREAKKEREEL